MTNEQVLLALRMRARLLQCLLGTGDVFGNREWERAHAVANAAWGAVRAFERHLMAVDPDGDWRSPADRIMQAMGCSSAARLEPALDLLLRQSVAREHKVG